MSWKSVALIEFADEIPSRWWWAKRENWKRVDEDNATLTLESGVMMEPRLSDAHLKDSERKPIGRFGRLRLNIPLNAGGGPTMSHIFSRWARC